MKLFWRSASVFGVLDYPNDGTVAEDAIQVRGWVISRTRRKLALEIEVDGITVDLRINRSKREEVRALHAKYAQFNPEPGYFALLSTHTLSPGPHRIAVRAGAGAAKRLIGQATIHVPARDAAVEAPDDFYLRNAGLVEPEDRLLFVHIPKTAGTSLAAYLSAQFDGASTLTHAENQVLGRTRAEVGRLDDYRLVTAHLKLHTLEKFLDRRRYFAITVLRDPVRQLASHLAWVKRLADPQKREELQRSPPYIQDAVRRIDTLDLVEFLDTMDERERYLFDNCQFRYMLGENKVDIGEGEIPEALARLGSLDLVGTTERLYDFLLVLAFSMGWAPPPRAPRLNTGKKDYFFDLENAGDALQARIERLTRLDRLLYRQAEVLFESRFRGMLKTLSSQGGLREELNPARVSELLRKANEGSG